MSCHRLPRNNKCKDITQPRLDILILPVMVSDDTLYLSIEVAVGKTDHKTLKLSRDVRDVIQCLDFDKLSAGVETELLIDYLLAKV